MDQLVHLNAPKDISSRINGGKAMDETHFTYRMSIPWAATMLRN
jgi:hypothetical protein